MTPTKLISFLYWESRYQIRKRLWDRAAKHSRINGIVLMYHHVTDDYVNTNRSCKCKIDVFNKVLDRLRNDGRKFVSLDEMMDIIETKRNESFAVVTFDDVPDSFYYNAYPILKQKSIPFVLFVTISFIDKPGYLTKKDIIELDKDPLCTIGAHTLTHPMLRKVSNSRSELVESKQILESMLGHTIDYMAYPFGRQTSISHRIMRETKKAGYKCSFGTIQSRVSDISARSMYYLPRIVMNE